MIYIHVRDDTDPRKAKEQVDQLKTLAHEEFDREVQVWTQSFVVCRDTEREARDFWNHYVHDLGDFEAADNLMRIMGMESAVLGDDWARERDRFISGWGGTEMIGTPERIAERFAGLAEAGLDGTLLLFPIWEQGLAQFREQVLPLLEQAGLREPYIRDTQGTSSARARWANGWRPTSCEPGWRSARGTPIPSAPHRCRARSRPREPPRRPTMPTRS
jgi:alkanesulfonate monooxygenase SsuD/methylene tetrahydromethanopterin reductase-like flavin-dependent oxidoreductase (luciferase family)